MKSYSTVQYLSSFQIYWVNAGLGHFDGAAGYHKSQSRRKLPSVPQSWFSKNAFDQFALQGRKEAPGHGIVIGVAYRAHRRFDSHFLALFAKRQAGVLGCLGLSVE